MRAAAQRVLLPLAAQRDAHRAGDARADRGARRAHQGARGARERGAAHFKQGEMADALMAFEEAASHDPKEPKVHLNRSAAFLQVC